MVRCFDLMTSKIAKNTVSALSLISGQCLRIQRYRGDTVKSAISLHWQSVSIVSRLECSSTAMHISSITFVF